MKKNFKKKCIAYVTAVVLALVAIPAANMSGVVSVAADDGNSTTIDGVTYTISGEKEAKVTSGADAKGNLTIADTVKINGETYNVTSVGKKAFYQNGNIESVTVGNNVTTLEEDAFCECTALKAVSFRTGLSVMGVRVFDGCTALESIDIPYGVTELQAYAFESCTGLKRVTLPTSMTGFSNSVFANCTSLKSIELPENVEIIGRGAFTSCIAMTSISISSSVTKIEGIAFENCSSLTNITIPCNFKKNLFLPEGGSTDGSCVVPLEDDDSYLIVSSLYYREGENSMGTSNILARGTFTYTHDIQYKANEATITASCKNCNSNMGSVTIVAPTELEYTCEPILATLSGKITASGVSTPTIQYTAADGSALTDGKPVEPGTYTASITLGGVTASVEYTISGNSYGSDDDYDSSDDDTSVSTDTASSSSAQVLNVASDNVVASGAPVEDVALENSTEELLSSDIFTATEKRLIANGSSAKVYVGIDSLPAENVPQADRNAIESEATASLGTNFAIQYMDMSLFKQIGNAASQKVSEPGVGIKVTVELPSNLINRNAGVSRRYVVIRLHDGVVTTLETTFDSTTNKLAFSTDRFSTYAIAYTDEAVGSLVTSGSPKTGDSANVLAMIALMAVAGMMMFGARATRILK